MWSWFCKKYWPVGSCIFVHADSKLPKGFIEDPNSSWPNYSIVCGSPKMKVGISMTLMHFDIIFTVSFTSPLSDQSITLSNL